MRSKGCGRPLYLRENADKRKKIIIIISQEDLGRFPGCGYPVRRFKSAEIEIRNILLFVERIRIIQLHRVI